MRLIQVKDSISERQFLDVPKVLYKNDPNWVCPLDKQINDLFKKETNSYLKKGECNRWVLIDDNKELLGRIAAFYHKDKAMANNEQPTGGIGFFESINDTTSAFLLFDQAKEWLKENGIEAMDGPINIGETLMNWGLLVKGFSPPAFGMTYNFPYYRELFEQYGFKLYFRQYSFLYCVDKPFPERFWKIADWVSKKPGFTFEHFTFKNQKKYLEDLCSIYNEAWSEFKKDFNPLEYSDIKASFDASRPIIDEKLVWFAYHNGTPIGVFIMYPDVNQIFKHFNGKMNLWNMLRFLYFKKRKKVTRLRTMLAGVVPKFHNSGIESAILSKFRDVVLGLESYNHYKEVELSWTGDFNPRMQSIFLKTGADWIKTHYTYRYLFDRNKEFVRFMPENVHLLGEEYD